MKTMNKLTAILAIIQCKEFKLIVKTNLEGKPKDEYSFLGNMSDDTWNYVVLHLWKKLIK